MPNRSHQREQGTVAGNLDDSKKKGLLKEEFARVRSRHQGPNKGGPSGEGNVRKRIQRKALKGGGTLAEEGKGNKKDPRP